MRAVVGILLLKLCALCPSAIADDPLPRASDLRQVSVFYAMDEAVLRAEARLESGRPGYEMGACGAVGEAAVANTCLPERSLQYDRFALAWQWQINRWVMDNESRREAVCRSFAARYHSGGTGKTDEERAENNARYAKDLLKIIRQEREYIAAREKVEGWRPPQPSGS